MRWSLSACITREHDTYANTPGTDLYLDRTKRTYIGGMLDLATKQMLIAKAYDALPVSGAFVVFEATIDDKRRRNAFDYTGAGFAVRMREAGFQHTRVEHLSGPDSMVIGIK